MVNIFTFDTDKYDIEEASQIFNKIKEVLPQEDILIGLPKGCNLYTDVSIDMLYYYRKMFDEVIEERQRRNAEKNAL